jgi:hypothetical protein
MAVRTSHVTFLNLLVDALPRPISTHQQTDRPRFIFTFSVVEFQHYGIALTTINTRMRLQILIYLLCLFFTQSVSALSVRPLVVIVVRIIPLLPVFFKASAAPRRPTIARTLSCREIGRRLNYLAPRTSLRAFQYNETGDCNLIHSHAL